MLSNFHFIFFLNSKFAIFFTTLVIVFFFQSYSLIAEENSPQLVLDHKFLNLAGSDCLKAFKKFQEKEGFSAFAVSDKGACGYGWSYPTLEKANQEAIRRCERYNNKCNIAAYKKRLSWQLSKKCQGSLKRWQRSKGAGAFIIEEFGSCTWTNNYPRLKFAINKALRSCKKNGKNCRVYKTISRKGYLAENNKGIISKVDNNIIISKNGNNDRKYKNNYDGKSLAVKKELGNVISKYNNDKIIKQSNATKQKENKRQASKSEYHNLKLAKKLGIPQYQERLVIADWKTLSDPRAVWRDKVHPGKAPKKLSEGWHALIHVSSLNIPSNIDEYIDEYFQKNDFTDIYNRGIQIQNIDRNFNLNQKRKLIKYLNLNKEAVDAFNSFVKYNSSTALSQTLHNWIHFNLPEADQLAIFEKAVTYYLKNIGENSATLPIKFTEIRQLYNIKYDGSTGQASYSLINQNNWAIKEFLIKQNYTPWKDIKLSFPYNNYHEAKSKQPIYIAIKGEINRGYTVSYEDISIYADPNLERLIYSYDLGNTALNLVSETNATPAITIDENNLTPEIKKKTKEIEIEGGNQSSNSFSDECEKLAGDPYLKESIEQGVKFEAIQFDKAISKCEQAVKINPSFYNQYKLARALLRASVAGEKTKYIKGNIGFTERIVKLLRPGVDAHYPPAVTISIEHNLNQSKNCWERASEKVLAAKSIEKYTPIICVGNAAEKGYIPAKALFIRSYLDGGILRWPHATLAKQYLSDIKNVDPKLSYRLEFELLREARKRLSKNNQLLKKYFDTEGDIGKRYQELEKLYSSLGGGDRLLQTQEKLYSGGELQAIKGIIANFIKTREVTKENIVELRKLLRLSKKLNDGFGESTEASLMEEGKWLKRDIKGAFNLFKSSYDKGSKVGAYNLARHHLLGISRPKNERLAYEILLKAEKSNKGLSDDPNIAKIEKDLVRSMLGPLAFKLGTTHARTDKNNDVDLKKAFEYYFVAAGVNNQKARLALGYMYRTGKGAPAKNLDWERIQFKHASTCIPGTTGFPYFFDQVICDLANKEWLAAEKIHRQEMADIDERNAKIMAFGLKITGIGLSLFNAAMMPKIITTKFRSSGYKYRPPKFNKCRHANNALLYGNPKSPYGCQVY